MEERKRSIMVVDDSATMRMPVSLAESKIPGDVQITKPVDVRDYGKRWLDYYRR